MGRPPRDDATHTLARRSEPGCSIAHTLTLQPLPWGRPPPPHLSLSLPLRLFSSSLPLPPSLSHPLSSLPLPHSSTTLSLSSLPPLPLSQSLSHASPCLLLCSGTIADHRAGGSRTPSPSRRRWSRAASFSRESTLSRFPTYSGLLTKQVHLNATQPRPFPSNRVVTSRYTLVSFVPVSLFSLLNPFNKVANFYFLCVGCMQMMPAITITQGRAGTFMPLTFVLLVDMVMRALEDYARHRADAETNSQPVDVLHGTGARPIDASRPFAPWRHADAHPAEVPADTHVSSGRSSFSEPSFDPTHGRGRPQWQTLTWEEVRVGDVVRIPNRSGIPADMLLLGAGPEAGSAWVNTKPLDGESDTKLRLALPQVADFLAEADNGPDLAFRLGSLSGTLRCEAPNDKVNDFVGLLQLAPSGPLRFGGVRAAIGPENMLLRGCVLRNTEVAYGLVVCAGDECKINFSAVGRRSREAERSGHIARRLNVDIAGVAVLLAGVCVAGAVGAALWKRDAGMPWYLALDPPPPAVRPWDEVYSLYAFLCNVGRFFLLSYQFIPVSLYVSISMVSSINAYFVRQDLALHDESQDAPCVVRSMALLEELGQARSCPTVPHARRLRGSRHARPTIAAHCAHRR